MIVDPQGLKSSLYLFLNYLLLQIVISIKQKISKTQDLHINYIYDSLTSLIIISPAISNTTPINLLTPIELNTIYI